MAVRGTRRVGVTEARSQRSGLHTATAGLVDDTYRMDWLVSAGDVRFPLPTALDWLGGTPAGQAWRAALPGNVAACEQQWELVLGEPLLGGCASLVLPAQRVDGSEAVLKLQFPDRESEHEAAALEQWAGEGAVQLLEHDPERHALLLERCAPGTALSEVGQDEALDVYVDLLPRLWKPAGATFTPLADEAAWWASSLGASWEQMGRPFERTLLELALDVLATLPQSQGEPVLLHQDLHADNVLRNTRMPWLAIDPKPLAGEREFGVAPIVRSFELGHTRKLVRQRLDRLTAELGLDRERARLWTIAQTIAWCFDSTYLPRHLATVRWLA